MTPCCPPGSGTARHGRRRLLISDSSPDSVGITMTWPMRSGHGSSPSDTNCPFGKGTLVSKDEVLRNVLRTFGTRRAGTFPENARPEVPSACCSERDLVTSKDVTDLRVSKIDYQRSTDSVTPPTRIAELGGSVTTDGYGVVARHRTRAS